MSGAPSLAGKHIPAGDNCNLELSTACWVSLGPWVQSEVGAGKSLYQSLPLWLQEPYSVAKCSVGETVLTQPPGALCLSEVAARSQLVESQVILLIPGGMNVSLLCQQNRSLSTGTHNGLFDCTKICSTI